MTPKRIQVDCDLRQPLVASVSEFKQVLRLDVRHHYERDGELLPTKRGVNVPVDQAMDLVAAIEQLVPSEGETAVQKQVDLGVREPVFVTASVFNNEMRLDVRHYYDDYGQLKPGRKGINLPWCEREKLLAALHQALE